MTKSASSTDSNDAVLQVMTAGLQKSVDEFGVAAKQQEENVALLQAQAKAVKDQSVRQTVAQQAQTEAEVAASKASVKVEESKAERLQESADKHKARVDEVDDNYTKADDLVENLNVVAKEAALAQQLKNPDGSDMGFFKKMLYSLGGSEVQKYSNAVTTQLSTAASIRSQTIVDRGNLVNTEVVARTLRGSREIEVAKKNIEINAKLQQATIQNKGEAEQTAILADAYQISESAVRAADATVKNAGLKVDATSKMYQNIILREQLRLAQSDKNNDDRLRQVIENGINQYNDLNPTTPLNAVVVGEQMMRAVKSQDPNALNDLMITNGASYQEVGSIVLQGQSRSKVLQGQTTFSQLNSAVSSGGVGLDSGAQQEISLLSDSDVVTGLINDNINKATNGVDINSLPAREQIAIRNKASADAAKSLDNPAVMGEAVGDMALSSVGLSIGSEDLPIPLQAASLVDILPESIQKSINSKAELDKVANEALAAFNKSRLKGDITAEEQTKLLNAMADTFSAKLRAGSTKVGSTLSGLPGVREKITVYVQGVGVDGRARKFDVTNPMDLQEYSNGLLVQAEGGAINTITNLAPFAGMQGLVNAIVNPVEAANTIKNVFTPMDELKLDSEGNP